MSSIINAVKVIAETTKNKGKIYIDIWSKRIDYVISQLISIRLMHGKAL